MKLRLRATPTGRAELWASDDRGAVETWPVDLDAEGPHLDVVRGAERTAPTSEGGASWPYPPEDEAPRYERRLRPPVVVSHERRRRPGLTPLKLDRGESLPELFERQVERARANAARAEAERRARAHIAGRPIYDPAAIDEQIRRAQKEGARYLEGLTRRHADETDVDLGRLDDDDATGGRT